MWHNTLVCFLEALRAKELRENIGEDMLGFDRITFEPHVMGGRACIRVRITVALVVNLVANGMTITEIIDAYPYLEPEDIHQALHYVAFSLKTVAFLHGLGHDAVYLSE